VKKERFDRIISIMKKTDLEKKKLGDRKSKLIQ
jgi:hypothetical protein